MHAYAAEDPVFRAMNARGQEETGGELGSFCVTCHAPMALKEGLTEDGLDLDTVPVSLRGITCAYCHFVDGVEGNHNAQLTLREDGVLAGGLAQPMETTAHASTYSSLHDRNTTESSDLCGPCHDIVTPSNVHLERTYAEWQETIFADDGVARLSCSSCHMPGALGEAADVPDAVERLVHDHRFPGVDVALTDFPDRDGQRQGVEEALGRTLLATLCVLPIDFGSEVLVRLENVGAGHKWPSGAAHDRRAWVEVIASNEAGDVVFATGDVEDGQAVVDDEDPYQWLFRDRLFDGEGTEVHMFWEAEGKVESSVLPATTTLDPADPAYYHYVERRFPILGQVPARVTLRVRLRPMGLDVLDDLVQSGHLDPAIRAAIPTFDLESTLLTWEGELDTCVPTNNGLGF